MDLSKNPISIATIKEELGYQPRGAVRRIVKRQDEVKRMISKASKETALLGRGQGATGTTAKRHGVRYPWNDWFARKKFTLVRSRDFQGFPHGMIQTIRQAAARAGIRVTITFPLPSSVGEDQITVEVKDG